MNISKQPSAIVLHHFFHPDDVVSARHFSDFAEELVKRGWEVTVLTSNRYCRDPRRKVPIKKENWRGIHIIRVARPGWDQSNKFMRLANALWMMVAWIFRIFTLPRADVIVIGSDPQFSQLLFPAIKFLKRESRLVYWCYDLFPEAILADGASGLVRWVARNSKYITKKAYESVDLMVDIGQCMRKRLDTYEHPARSATLTPWALIEPITFREPDPIARHDLFGNAPLALLYSGNMGKAHDFELLLDLARNVYRLDAKIIFCFACRGNRVNDLKSAVTPHDCNIRLAPFSEEQELEKRLNAADIHLLSLKPEWEGIVVPSKFFGSLAVGKPVIYAGPENSSIAYWIREFDVGLVLTEKNMRTVAGKLIEIAQNPDALRKWHENALNAYQIYFSKKVVMGKWDIVMRDLLERRADNCLREWENNKVLRSFI